MCDAVLRYENASDCDFLWLWQAEIQPLSWEVANERTYVPWAEQKYDIMMFGMPQAFHYGNGHGTNPILMYQAIGAQVIRHRRVMRDNFVIICSSICKRLLP